MCAATLSRRGVSGPTAARSGSLNELFLMVPREFHPSLAQAREAGVSLTSVVCAVGKGTQPADTARVLASCDLQFARTAVFHELEPAAIGAPPPAGSNSSGASNP